MQKLLQSLEKISLASLDNPKNNVLDSEIYNKYLNVVPQLKPVLDNMYESNPEELQRTMQHTLRALLVYSKFNNEKFPPQNTTNLSLESIITIQTLLNEATNNKPKILSLILAFHDIGRPFNREAHSYESARLIEEFNLLDAFNLNENEIILVLKAIEYHLLVGSIYSGESTFYYLTSLCQDQKFTILLEDIHLIKQFASLVSVFTIFDIWGYGYGRIFDHYPYYYVQLRDEIVKLLSFWPDLDTIISESRKTSESWLDWRMAAAVRIFQYLGTTPKLTNNFYTNLIKKAASDYLQKDLTDASWSRFKQENFSQIHKVQLKYGLGLLQRLASGHAYMDVRRGCIPSQIRSDLIQFWVLLNQKILDMNRVSTFPHAIWNVSVEGLPSLYADAWTHLLKLDMKDFKDVLTQMKPSYDFSRQENNARLDFSTTF